MTRNGKLVVVVMVLGGCAEEVSIPETGSRGSAIVNGAVDNGHPAVGILHSANLQACTATLVGKRTVITAAHCVTTENPPYSLLSPVNFYLGGFNGMKHIAAQVIVHGSYAGGNQSDIAIVRLAQDVSGVTPMKVATAAPKLGETVDLVGYGKTGEDAGEFGTKRHAVNSIGKVQTQTFSVYGAGGAKGNLCNGDSGGPTFANRGGQEELIGVHSTKGGVCGQEGNDMRVDAFYGWIAQQAQGDLWTGAPADGAAPSVAIVSPANGSEVAGGGVAVQVNATDDVGVTRMALYIDGQKASEKGAAPWTFQLQNLAPGKHAVEAVAFDAAGHSASSAIEISVVQAGAPPPPAGPGAPAPAAKGAFGAACERPDECEGGLCALDNASGARFCTAYCQLDAGACPSGSSCVPVGQTAVCGPLAPPAAPAVADELTGGCRVAGSAASTASFLPLAIVALLALLRPRRS
jgi:V8-like Glu-specific endopeptidase